MPVTNKTVGARIFYSIGHRGQRPDVYPARIVSAPRVVPGPRGLMEVADIVMERANQAGSTFKAPKLIDLLYARDRTELVEALDGTEAQPKTVQQLIAEQASEFAAFQESQVQELNVEDLA